MKTKQRITKESLLHTNSKIQSGIHSYELEKLFKTTAFIHYNYVDFLIPGMEIKNTLIYNKFPSMYPSIKIYKT